MELEKRVPLPTVIAECISMRIPLALKLLDTSLIKLCMIGINQLANHTHSHTTETVLTTPVSSFLMTLTTSPFLTVSWFTPLASWSSMTRKSSKKHPIENQGYVINVVCIIAGPYWVHTVCKMQELYIYIYCAKNIVCDINPQNTWIVQFGGGCNLSSTYI